MAAQEAKFADPDQVWKIWIKDGKETPLHFTTVAKLRNYKDKFPDVFDAVFGKKEDGSDGLMSKIESYVMSQGTEGEAQPTAEVGDWIIGIRYYEESDSYSISRKPKRAYSGGGRSYSPLLTLDSILTGELDKINAILSMQKAGEIYRFSEMKDGQVTVLKLRKVE